MLSFVGIGLSSPDDITIRGKRVAQSADRVILESYTSRLDTSHQELERTLNTDIEIGRRQDLEQGADDIVEDAKNRHVCILIIGDVFGATTHSMIHLEARKAGVQTQIVHNASILTAVSQTGLQLYNFGKTTSIVFPDNNWYPDTPYNDIKQNQEHGLHTLCLLDIKVAEPSREDLLRGKDAPQEPRYMTAKQAAKVLLTLEEKHGENIVSPTTKAVGVQNLGGPNQDIWYTALQNQPETETPLQSLIIPGKLHELEQEMLKTYE